MMMARDIFSYGTVLFMLGLGYVAVKCPHTQPVAATCEMPKVAAKMITLPELARHDKPTDCWMAIDGKVYELHGFIDLHPSASGVIEPYCGKEASNAYAVIETGKLKGKPHSERANEMLAEYVVGELVRD